MDQPKINKQQYDDKKKKCQEGFTTSDGGTYQVCTPLTTEEGESVEEYTVTKSSGSDVIEDAQTMFLYWMGFLLCAAICSIVSPAIAIYAAYSDRESSNGGGNGFRLGLTIIFWVIFITSIILIGTIASDISKKSKTANATGGLYLLICWFFIYISITSARISKLVISEDLDYGKIYPDPVSNSYLYLDIFSLFHKLQEKSTE